MLKTVWLINQFAGTPEIGGNQRHFHFAQYWKQKGYRTVIISNSNNHLVSKKNHGIKGFHHENGIPFYWIPTLKHTAKSPLRFVSMISFAVKVLGLFFKSRSLGKPDLIILSSVSIFPMIPALMLSRFFGAKKFIFEVRDLWPLTPIMLLGYSKKNILIRFVAWLEKLGYTRSDEIVSLLKGSDKYINAISKDPKKFHCIPNGIPSNFLKNNLSDDSIYKKDDKKITLTYAGSFGFANALDPFIQFLGDQGEIAHQINVILIGDGPYLASYKKQLIQQKNIQFLGRISREEVGGYLKDSDVLFIAWHKSPIYQYGVSANKYYDYMASSKPILSAHEGFNDLVDQYNCGISVRNRKSSIENGLREFLSLTKEEKTAMGERGRKAVENYTYEKLAQQYIEVMER